MKLPQLKKKPEIKSCHDVTWEDNYSWIHQDNILDVLKDKDKLDIEVREYLEKENEYTNHQLKDTKNTQDKLFKEIKGRIKLDDEILAYKDHTYEYWTKTTTEGNYSIKLRKKIGSEIIGGKGGGGRKDFAQAGGQDQSKIEDAFKKLKDLI